MASKTYFFKFESREECYKVCRSVGYCFTDSVTGDTVMDVPGAGHIDVAGRFYDPEKQPMAPSPEGEMEPDPENIIWHVEEGEEEMVPSPEIKNKQSQWEKDEAE